MARAVFLSYAREDTAAALRIAEALRSHGVEVWFDQSELRGGDAWDQKIRSQIKECALFVPIVSEKTRSRREGYFRLEWKLAVERTHLMAEGVPFLAPVVVDATPETAAVVPAEFLRVQWIRLPGAFPTPQFVEQIKGMLDEPVDRVGSAPQAHAATRTRPSRSRPWTIGALAAVIVALLVALVMARRPLAPPVAAPAEAQPRVADSKSIAVLPFENMSEDKGNAFFADGIHEDVLTSLSFIRDLHVVSRTSVMQYRGTTKPIKQIGQELGVAYVLEGSVRREGNKVRVTGQLIDARTDEHVWANAYDREVTDIFAIQGELAEAIASALQSVISPETKALKARRPTENSEAYDDYLKARQILNSTFVDGYDPAVSLLSDAVRLDPKFAAAWAELASMRAFAYFSLDQSEGQFSVAKEAIDNAVRLAPGDPSVIEGLGDYYYYGYRDYLRATEQYMKLAQMRPNDPEVYHSLGLIQRRQGRFTESLANLRQGLVLDPASFDYVVEITLSLMSGNRYGEADDVMRNYATAHQATLETDWWLNQIAFLSRGATDGVEAFSRRQVDPSAHVKHLFFRKADALMTGNWAEFARLDSEQRYFDGIPWYTHWTQDVSAAECFAESGDMAAARKRASEAMVLMKPELVRQPDNAILWAELSLANALLGNRDETLRSAKRSAELLPESRDAVAGPANSVTCAYAFAWIGEKDRAMAEFERLLRVPFGNVNIYSSRASWRPLRDEPRFKALVSDLRNNDPLY